MADRGSASAREIAAEVYCLGPWGHTRTNVYAVGSSSSWVLVDTGWAGDAERVREHAVALFGAASRPEAILLTHCHPDHSGAAPSLTRSWDRPAYLHPEELPIALGDFDAMLATAHPLDRWVSLPIMRAMGTRRRAGILAHGSLGRFAHILRPGQPVPGLPGWECLATPGHTPGHVSFFRSADRVLISGDALLTVRLDSVRGLVLPRAGLAGPPWYTTWSPAAAAGSIQLIAALRPQVLAAGHGVAMIGPGTAAAVTAFAANVQGRRPPVR